MAVGIDQARQEGRLAQVNDRAWGGGEIAPGTDGGDAIAPDEDRPVRGMAPGRQARQRGREDHTPSCWRLSLPRAAVLRFRALYRLWRSRICCSIFLTTRSMAA